jgi:hypothetical protein
LLATRMNLKPMPSWIFLDTFEYIWTYLNLFNSVKRSLKMFNNFNQCMNYEPCRLNIFEHVWTCLNMFEHFWTFLNMFNSIQCNAIFSNYFVHDIDQGFTTQGIHITQTIWRYPWDTIRNIVPSIKDTPKDQDQDLARLRRLVKAKTSNKKVIWQDQDNMVY